MSDLPADYISHIWCTGVGCSKQIQTAMPVQNPIRHFNLGETVHCAVGSNAHVTLRVFFAKKIDGVWVKQTDDQLHHDLKCDVWNVPFNGGTPGDWYVCFTYSGRDFALAYFRILETAGTETTLPPNIVFSSNCTGAGTSKQSQDYWAPIENPTRQFDSGEMVHYSVYGINSVSGDIVTQTWYKRIGGKWIELSALNRSSNQDSWSWWHWNSYRSTLDDGVYCVSYRYNNNDFADIYFSVGVQPEDIDVTIIEYWVNPTVANKLDTVEFFMKVDGTNKEHIGSLGCSIRDKDGVEYDLPLATRPSFGWSTVEVSIKWLQALMLTPPVAVRFSAWYETADPLYLRLADTGWIEDAIIKSFEIMRVTGDVSNTGNVELICHIENRVYKKDTYGKWVQLEKLFEIDKTIGVGDKHHMTECIYTPDSPGDYAIGIVAHNKSDGSLLGSCYNYYTIQ